MDIHQRFWSKVDRGSEDECWEWQAYRNRQGYGDFELWNPATKTKKTAKAHRVAYELHHGEPPKGTVCHTCDNPPCCNPSHLYDGSPKSNARDREERGRNGWSSGELASRNTARGSRNGRTNLTEDSVREIRRLYAKGGISQQRLSEMFQVGQTRISSIVRRETWKHVV